MEIEKIPEIQSCGAQFPEEIVEDILSRLAVKAVLRFRCVSKSWQSTIGSERFIKKHLKISTRNTFVIVASEPAKSSLRSLGSEPVKMWRCSLASLFNKPDIHDLKFNFPPMSTCPVSLAGCCDGLVCLLLNEKEFILWNPSTRISRKLPPVAYTKEYDGDTLCYGFGYDEWSGDYKVMSLIRPAHVCRVYSLKSDSWKTANGWNTSNLPCRGEGKFASGKLHWMPRAAYNCIQDVEIVSFDMSREICGLVEKPHLGSERAVGKLGKLGECLSLLCCYPTCLDVWVMKEYGVKESWQKLVIVDDALFDIWKDPWMTLFCIGSQGEIIFMENGSFFIYYPDACYKRVGNLNSEYYQADIYYESLLQP